MDEVTVYDQSGKLLAVLDNADGVSYELKHNDLWTGSFSLPAGDPKNAYCQAHNLVKLPDGTRDTGIYRIIGMPSAEETATGGMREYSVEHVMATLLDDVLFGYHEIGGVGITTREVMQYILDRQTVTRWVLGEVAFNDEFQYKFENVSLLSALLSLGEVLTEEYTWDFDTSATPWVVNLRKADTTEGCGIHYARNLASIEKTMDASALVTRLYPLGYGEGVNQLTIRSVNGGVPYLDADTAATWGIKCSVYADTRIEDAANLKARAAAVLEGYKNPYITYTAQAIDLHRITGQSWDNYMPGKKVRVMDGEHGISFAARIVSISKKDLRGDPGSVEITIANAVRDVADSINTLADRVGIGELYSQGATQIFAVPFADNADPDHPAKMRFYVPSGLVRINRMQLSWELSAFRAYETGAAAGGSTTQTSSSGGASTATSNSNEDVACTSEADGEMTISQPMRILSSDGGGTATATSELSNLAGSGYYTAANTSGLATEAAGEHAHTISHTHSIGAHSHTCYSHTHTINSHNHSFSGSQSLAWGHRHSYGSIGSGGNTGGVVSYSAKTISVSGTTGGKTLTANEAGGGDSSSVSLTTGGANNANSGVNGSHSHDIPSHTHNFQHAHKVVFSINVPGFEVNVPAHTHNVKIPGHKHTVGIPSHTHSLTLPDHTHNITYGIFEGTTARSVQLLVDGTEVPSDAISNRELDISAYLEKDEDGKITRNAWHTVELVPDKLTRIEANLFAQTFIQSTGGGDY
ncbi:MAG: phage tail spike protein [Clostridia bacterium]|nr:phage tail spike protein [Clostridia bacterium]